MRENMDEQTDNQIKEIEISKRQDMRKSNVASSVISGAVSKE